MSKQHLGVIGLGVMGSNLALNAESKGFSAAGFDLDQDKVAKFEALGRGKKIVATCTLKDFTASLETPRRILMMVPAGAPVDAVIKDLRPLLTREDIVIDGGNSYFKDTERRAKELDQASLSFFGMGVSGGEEGALHGPSLMPGGREESYRHLEAVLTKMAAQTPDGACCTYLGPGGAGHYVKMVHNGIEYGIMQAICEVYDLLQTALGLSATELHDLFAAWNGQELDSFLIEITALVLAKIDPETKKPLVDLILDEAEQKGTGKWTAQDSLDLGVAIPSLSAAVYARVLSALKPERVAASAILNGPAGKFSGEKKSAIETARHALEVAMVVCYAQGFEQLRVASADYKYDLKMPDIARIWKGGCIIRSKMLDPIAAAFREKPDLKNLMISPHFSGVINRQSDALREAVKLAVDLGVSVPLLASSLNYIDGYRQKRLPANLLQALRDCFGAHTYRRTDRDGVFHTGWMKK
ncbi:MAG TPA: NADP-dependent phosphogluconate dehydrogenase [Terriglobia bacterium]|nr:NADP-dependent phosphogluconate dehydrogenase [Terriglobia bacterium]